ncbi:MULTISPECIES: DNA polymerase III subunit delta [Roseivirga]|jgi:DNA polymerase-3 subunit delta|uniref:DNA polymerase III subunit delta n=1 Tax=Roseivirga thermotolerans TaxID=1758176 RepID=A0ABQ3ICG1_9BACT|nr:MULTISPECIES: DNA polymerase III subunit delta [Roseivirga]MEC7753266.1 DNA polymerase III subunit delta [Bacteroidota bacterium]GHE73535.1 DNA polymerase III subunit delta [Roseivirga thermotolerans]|tara:strand:+ start:152 stop:1174 length:1023 start_codon:yes stop_codon:yes gene_type:complete
MAVTPDQILSDLKAGKYAPVYFLQGEEPYYIDQISDYIEDHCLAEAEKGFNQTIMYGKDVAMSQVLTAARRFPMMAERQVVIVKEAKDIQDINKEEGQSLLINYLDNPVPSTVLVFAHKHKKVDGRKPLAKALSKKALLLTTTKLRDYEVPKWIEGFAKEKGFNIGYQSVQMLAEYLGNNLERLSNEVNKIAINLKPGEEITPAHIQKYVGINKDYNVFELQKAISTGDVLKANRIVNYFSANIRANSIIPMIAVLYSYYTKLLLLHSAKDKSDSGLARAMGLPPFVVKEYKVAANRYPLQKVMQCISHLREADLRSKGVDSGSMPEEEILRELVFKLMH